MSPKLATTPCVCMAQIPKQELDAAVKKALDSQAAAKDKEVTPTVDLLLELRADLLDIAGAAGHDRDGVEVLYQVPQRSCLLVTNRFSSAPTSCCTDLVLRRCTTERNSYQREDGGPVRSRALRVQLERLHSESSRCHVCLGTPGLSGI